MGEGRDLGGHCVHTSLLYVGVEKAAIRSRLDAWGVRTRRHCKGASKAAAPRPPGRATGRRARQREPLR
ncbi:hypothetical protein A8F59_08050 [Burkholderia cenocepacia]|nr:hypothetical protein A8F59_08050 [Burkholderia cenocepacia]OOB32959.1 hypothetical protein A8F74_27060 [Burkholderia cenocepacia]